MDGDIMASFEILMEVLNSTIKTLNEHGWYIRDNLDPEHYISCIYYEPDRDELYFDTKEEEATQRWSAESDIW